MDGGYLRHAALSKRAVRVGVARRQLLVIGHLSTAVHDDGPHALKIVRGEVAPDVADDGEALLRHVARTALLVPVAVDGLLAVRAHRDDGDADAGKLLEKVDVVLGLARELVEVSDGRVS